MTFPLFVGSYGIEATLRPGLGWEDEIPVIVLILASAIAIGLHHRRKRLMQESAGTGTRLVLMLVFSLACSLHIGHFVSFHSLPYVTYSVTVAMCMAYCMAKYLLCIFVNRLFFHREQCHEWEEKSTILFSAETLVIFLGAVLLHLSRIAEGQLLIVVIFAVFILRLLSLFRTVTIFFPKYYGSFHFIMYLCALEAMPLLIAWQIFRQAALPLMTGV